MTIEAVSNAAAGHEADERGQLDVIGAVEDLQDGALLGIGDHVGRVIGGHPATLGHELMHLVGGALGLQDADVERQRVERQQAVDDLLDPAEPGIEDAAIAVGQDALLVVEEPSGRPRDRPGWRSP